ncbi:g563 [Coccomyxa viridis]|uniref:G563 protein n=1 Tax=Coccomyxa viridis TaxID=1274662 RepID=A0ABP1FMQ0_9CHLO
MQLPGSAFEWSLDLDDAFKGAPWILHRIQSTRKLSVRRWTNEEDQELKLDAPHQTVKAMIRTLTGFQNLTTLDIDICEGALSWDTCPVKRLLQRWAIALLFGSPKLTSLSMAIDDVFCPPELGLLSLRHLELTMCCVSHRLPDILADLRHSQIESLVIATADCLYDHPSSNLPDIFLHEVATLKSMENQDLAALKRIPHVCLEFTEFSTLLLTSGSWQSLQIKGKAGFSVSFSSVSAFVGGTKRFLFECTGQDGGLMQDHANTLLSAPVGEDKSSAVEPMMRECSRRSTAIVP